MTNPEGEHFAGTKRFLILRRIGAGGMGVVYEAHDQQRDERVALKTLARVSPELLYYLKQEFRSRRPAWGCSRPRPGGDRVNCSQALKVAPSSIRPTPG